MSKSTAPESPALMSPKMAERIMNEHRKMQAIIRRLAGCQSHGLQYELKDCIFDARKLCGWKRSEITSR